MAFLTPTRRFALTICKSAVTQRLPLASTSYISTRLSPVSSIDRVSIRGYAKKSKKGKSRDDDDDAPTTVIKTKGKSSTKNGVAMAPGKKSKGDLIAGEEPIDLGDVDAVDLHDEKLVSDLDEKMQKPVNWCRGVGFDGVERGSGRVSPAILDSVRVNLPDYPSPEPIVNIASITVRQNALWVEVYDEASLKHVDSAIQRANLPGISPTKHDKLSLRIPISRPTAETRAAILKHIGEVAEQAKQQVRIARTDALKHIKHKSGKNSTWGKEAQRLTDKYTAEIDGLVSSAKKELAKA